MSDISSSDEPAGVDVDRAAMFDGERARLVRLAYRMSGSWSDAEDIVQDVWMRYALAGDVVDPAAWLTTVTSRMALDKLKSARHRREVYVGPWLPEPVDSAVLGVDDVVERAETVTFAFLVALDTLDPVHRAVFVLREVFGEPFETVAEVVGRSPVACRQIAARARHRVRHHHTKPDATVDEQLLSACLAAAASGRVDELEVLLADDVVHVSDGGADHRAARRPVIGRDRVARLLANLGSRSLPDAEMSIGSTNDSACLVVTSGGDPVLWMSGTANADGTALRRVWLVLNPDKLGGVSI